jgi:tRNA A37 methylthiotransferase MiaB
LREVRYDSIYAFKYSERPGTRSEKVGDGVPEAVKKARLQKLLDVQTRISAEKLERYRGQVVEILIEGPSTRANAPASQPGESAEVAQARDERRGFQVMGRTRTNVIVNVPVPFGDFWNKRWVGQLAHVEVVDVFSNSLFGRFL